MLPFVDVPQHSQRHTAELPEGINHIPAPKPEETIPRKHNDVVDSMTSSVAE